MLPQLLVSGLAQGAMYALIALSMTVIYRATTVVNFGHGDFVMAGAFFLYVLIVFAGLPYAAAMVLALIGMAVLGVVVERGLIGPVHRGPHIALAMMSIAVGYFLRGTARVFWGREVLPLPRVFDIEPILIGSVVITGDDLALAGASLLAVVLFFGLFHFTRFGKILQAIFQSARGAALVGIDVRSYHTLMWAGGAAMGALAGVVVGPITLLHPDLGAELLIRAFAAMTLGGFGSLGGAVLGGLTIGIAEQIGGAYLSTALIEITPYLVIIVVLMLRPAGLFGDRAAVRV